MNGVNRGNTWSNSAIQYRCGGLRWGASVSGVSVAKGFPVKGVNRGGAYDYTNHAQYTRICYIQQRPRRGSEQWVGFL